MKDLKTILEECSINDIYFSNRGTSILYKIPIYQRNYAWEREEIRALINDVYDSMTKSVYYIGTLVTYKRDENIYEVIDGQQRLTTIDIMINNKFAFWVSLPHFPLLRRCLQSEFVRNQSGFVRKKRWRQID